MKIFKILLMNLLLDVQKSTYVQNVLNENVFFSSSSKETVKDFSFNTNKDPIVEFTLFGWFKFNGTREGIANFVHL